MKDGRDKTALDVEALVRRGEKQGFLTALEIFSVLTPDLVEDLDELLVRLKRLGVPVAETHEEGIRASKDRKSRSSDEIAVGDALSSYLREVSGVSTLDRDAEIRCAREFRSGIQTALRAVAETRYFVEQLALRSSWIRRGRLSIWEVISRPSTTEEHDPPSAEASFLEEVDKIARRHVKEKRILEQLERRGMSPEKAQSLSKRLQEIRADRIAQIKALPLSPSFIKEIAAQLVDIHRTLDALVTQHGSAGSRSAHRPGSAKGNRPSTSEEVSDSNQEHAARRDQRNLKRKIRRLERQLGMSAAALGAVVRRHRTGMLRAQRARDALILSAQRLVLSSARYYGRRLGGSGMEISDLISEGNKGLIRAVELFDPDRGNRFSTFAGYWVRHQMIRAIHTQSRTVYVPPHIRQQMSKILAVENEFLQRTGQLPSDEELARASDMDVPSLRHTLQSFGRMSSIDRPLDPDDSGSGTYGDTLADERETPDEALEGAERREMVRALAEQLEGRERAIVFMRMGWENDDPKTLAEIGEAFGISRQRVEQLEKRALAKLRRWARYRGMEDPMV